MARKVTVELAEEVHARLNSAAAAGGTGIEAVSAQALRDAYSQFTQLTWRERDVLDLFKQRNARTGEMIPAQTLRMIWGVTRGSSDRDFTNDVDNLRAKGMLAADQGGSQYALTGAGYSAASGAARSAQ